MTPSPSFEVEHGHAEYTDAELLEQARGNVQALILATIVFLESRGIPPREWATAIGEMFSRGWGDPRPWDAGELLDAMLTNLRALGAEVVSVELGVDRAEAATTGFPDPELCALLGVDPAQVGVFHEAAGAIAAPRGLQWTWVVGDDGVTRYVVERLELQGRCLRRPPPRKRSAIPETPPHTTNVRGGSGRAMPASPLQFGPASYARELKERSSGSCSW